MAVCHACRDHAASGFNLVADDFPKKHCLASHRYMPADRRNATQRQNKLNREKFIQDTLQSINTGAIKSYRDATKVTGVSTTLTREVDASQHGRCCSSH